MWLCWNQRVRFKVDLKGANQSHGAGVVMKPNAIDFTDTLVIYWSRDDEAFVALRWGEWTW
jgi:hypothetical protein